MSSANARPAPSPAYSTDGEELFLDAVEDIKSDECPVTSVAKDLDLLQVPKNVSTGSSPMVEMYTAGTTQASDTTMQPEIYNHFPGALYGDDEDEETAPCVSSVSAELGLMKDEHSETEAILGAQQSVSVDNEDSQSERLPTTPETCIPQAQILIEPPNLEDTSFDYNVEEDGEKSELDLGTSDKGDELDDFGEVVGGEEFDDFEGFEEGDASNDFGEFDGTSQQELPLSQPAISILDFSQFFFKGDHFDVVSSMVSDLYPSTEPPLNLLPPLSATTVFLTDRSESLWRQLVAPPPLQPPNWKRSRIRRLFHVSLGVPVDLDEILPASKQKKLILPSTKRSNSTSRQSSSSSRRNSADSSAAGRSKSRLRERRNAEAGSRTPSSSRSGKKIDKTTSQLDFDMPAARILCSTSDIALASFTSQELREHVANLQRLTSAASEVLTYWLKKRDSAMSDKETFETVIESLVGYARKTRQSMR